VIDTVENQFDLFVNEVEPRLRHALVAVYGSDRGREAAAEALAYAWEHWSQLQKTDNPIGYLYRVGQSRTRPRKTNVTFDRPVHPESWYEPRLPAALASLTESQRTAVVLVYGFEWTLREVAECTGVKVTSVQNHLERGLKKLQAVLKVRDDVRPS
jgi:DNA-directed RNA polymerase specialized sigma24 family protein